MLLGIQGSGQLTDRAARPGPLPRGRRARRGARLRLDLGRRAPLVPQPDPRPRRRARDVRRRHRADRARSGRRAPPAAPPEPRREAGRVARLRLGRPAPARGRRRRRGGGGLRGGRRARRASAGARADEGIAALRALLRDRPASFAGRFYRFADVSIEPATRAAGRAAAPRRRPVGRRDPARGTPRRRLAAVPGLAAPLRARARERSTSRRTPPAASRDGALARARRSSRTSTTTASGHVRGDSRAPLGALRDARSSATTSSASASRARRRSALARIDAYAEAGAEHVSFNPAVEERRLPRAGASGSAPSRARGRRSHDASRSPTSGSSRSSSSAPARGARCSSPTSAPRSSRSRIPASAGDVGRYVPPFQEGEDSLFFETFNRGKKSVSLDLRHPGARERAARSRARLRRRLLEPPRRPAGEARAHLRAAARRQPAHRLLLALGLRDDRPARLARAATTT